MSTLMEKKGRQMAGQRATARENECFLISYGSTHPPPHSFLCFVCVAYTVDIFCSVLTRERNFQIRNCNQPQPEKISLIYVIIIFARNEDIKSIKINMA
jgi:hypothetical protein